MIPEQLSQVAAISEFLLNQRAEPQENVLIRKIVKKMTEKKDISKQFIFLAGCLQDGITMVENQKEEPQAQLAKLLTYLVAFHNENIHHKHYDGVEDLALAMLNLASHQLTFMVDNFSRLSPTSMEQILQVFEAIFTAKKPSTDIIKTISSIAFFSSSKNGDNTLRINLNDKPLIEVINQKVRITQRHIDQLVDLTFALTERNLHIEAKQSLVTLFDLLIANKQLQSLRLVAYFDLVIQKQLTTLWDSIQSHAYFQQSIEPSHQFSYRIEEFVRQVGDGNLESFNKRLLIMEKLSSEVKVDPQQFMMFINVILNLNVTYARLNVESFLKIVRNIWSKQSSDFQALFNEQVYKHWMSYSPHQETMEVVLKELFSLFTENYSGLCNIILEEIRQQSFSRISAQLIANIILKLRVDQSSQILQAFQSQLINRPKIDEYSLYLFHLTLIRFPQPVNTYFYELFEEVVNKPVSEKSIALIYSLFQIMTAPQSRQVTKYMQLLKSKFTIWDVCAVLSYQGAKRQPSQFIQIDNQKLIQLSEYLNNNLNAISNNLQKKTFQHKQQCMSGFYQIVIFFTNHAIKIDSSFKHSTFLHLFETVQTAMCTRNKTLNYGKLLTAVQRFEEEKTTENYIRLYTLLLKVNYIHGAQKDLKEMFKQDKTEEPQQDFASEISSEMGLELDDQHEVRFKTELLQHVSVNYKYLLKQIQELEQSFIREICSGLGIQETDLIENVINYVRATSICQGQPVKNLLGLEQYQLISDLISDEPNQEMTQLSQHVLTNLYHSNVTALATSLIQIFTQLNEEQRSKSQEDILVQLRMARLILAEVINLGSEQLALSSDTPLNEFQLRNYNFYFLIKHQEKDLSEVIKHFKLNSKISQFNAAYVQYYYHFEILNICANLPPEHLFNFSNILIQAHNQPLSDVQVIALVSVLFLKSEYNFEDCLAYQQPISSLLQIKLPTICKLQNIMMQLLSLYQSSKNPVNDWVGFLKMVLTLCRYDQGIKSKPPKTKRKKSKSKRSMEVEPYTFEDHIKTPEQAELFTEAVKFAFNNQMKKLFQSSDLFMRITQLTVENVYRQTCDSQSLQQVIQFYEYFMVPELSDSIINFITHLIYETLVSLNVDGNFVSIVAKVDHIIQLFNIAYQNHKVQAKIQVELGQLFGRAFSVIIKLQKLMNNLTLQQKDQLDESLSQLGFLIINFMKHLEKEAPSEQRPATKISQQQVFNQLIEILSDVEPHQREYCTYRPEVVDENIGQHFYTCHNCPLFEGRKMEVCRACAHQCHHNHPELEYDYIIEGFCDCGKDGGDVCQSLNKTVQPRDQPRTRGRLSSSLMQTLESKRPHIINDLFCRGISQNPFLHDQMSNSESDKDISRSSSEEEAFPDQPRSPIYNAASNAPVQSQRRSKEKRKSDVSESNDDDEEEDLPDGVMNIDKDSVESVQPEFDFLPAQTNPRFEERLFSRSTLQMTSRMKQNKFMSNIYNTNPIHQVRMPPPTRQITNNGSDIESIYPSDPDRASAASSSFVGHQLDVCSTIGRGGEIEEELNIYRGISQCFSNGSDVYQTVLLELQESLQIGDMNEVVKTLQETLFSLCQSCLLKYVDLNDLEGQLSDLIAFPQKRPKSQFKINVEKKVDIQVPKENEQFEFPRVDDIPLQLGHQFLAQKAIIKVDNFDSVNPFAKYLDEIRSQ